MALTSDELLFDIIVSGETFAFTRKQLESDPDNEFTRYFFGGAKRDPSPRLTLHIEGEPKLFTLIQAHLRGYPVFPIPDQIVPTYMTKATMVASLSQEAAKCRLSRLHIMTDEYIAKSETVLSQLPVTSPWCGPKKYQLGMLSPGATRRDWKTWPISEDFFYRMMEKVITSAGVLPLVREEHWPNLPNYRTALAWYANPDERSLPAANAKKDIDAITLVDSPLQTSDSGMYALLVHLK
ncbi:hypothetical protein CPB86DRAFT_741206 [Serendipita vermifera]|nr:hypothetical protein CPB86DRAFT_741206 [Serendipita vermifera]